MNSARNDAGLAASGCPIRTSSDQSLLSGSPKLFAASHVLHRLLAPRHPPYALSSLTTDVIATKCAFQNLRLPVCNCQRTISVPLRTYPCGLVPRCPTRLEQRAANSQSGADRNRTDDLRLARAALSHLSYSPVSEGITGLGAMGLARPLPPNRLAP